MLKPLAVLLVFAIQLFAPSPLLSQVLTPATPESVGVSSTRLKRIDENITAWLQDGRLNGCVALLIRNGKIVYHKGFGYDDLQKSKPILKDQIYRIA